MQLSYSLSLGLNTRLLFIYQTFCHTQFVQHFLLGYHEYAYRYVYSSLYNKTRYWSIHFNPYCLPLISQFELSTSHLFLLTYKRVQEIYKEISKEYFSYMSLLMTGCHASLPMWGISSSCHLMISTQTLFH